MQRMKLHIHYFIEKYKVLKFSHAQLQGTAKFNSETPSLSHSSKQDEAH